MDRPLFATIEYEEFTDGTMKIVVSCGDLIIKTYDDPDPLINWYDWKKDIYGDTFQNQYITCSSTFDHWFMDQDKYHEEYFDPESFEFIDWRAKQMYDVVDKYPSCVVDGEMKNFGDLKTYYKNWKNESS